MVRFVVLNLQQEFNPSVRQKDTGFYLQMLSDLLCSTSSSHKHVISQSTESDNLLLHSTMQVADTYEFGWKFDLNPYGDAHDQALFLKEHMFKACL